MPYLHRNSYNHNGEDQSTKCPVPKHLRKWQGINHGRRKTSVKSIHSKLNPALVSYIKEIRYKLVTSNNHEKCNKDTTQTTRKNTGYDKSIINNPQIIFLLGSKQITSKST